MNLVLRDIRLPLGAFQLEVDVTVQGRVIALFGPSGAGKTSLLELVAGLRRAPSAFIALDDEVLTDMAAGRCLPAHRRQVGYVPQDLALFPHLTVDGNLRYGWHRRPAAPGLDHVIAALEIEPLLDRRPAQISGGERQRVALGRALLAAPRVLLLDEPLASLDQPLKTRLLPYLARVRDEFRLPMIQVTHDRHEALALADQMIVLLDGKVAQAGPITELFTHPASPEVAGALTVETIQPGRVLQRSDELVTVRVGTTSLVALDPPLPAETSEVMVCIRADDVILVPPSALAASPRNHLPGTVRSLRREGPLVRVELDCGFPLAALLTRPACEELQLAPGGRVLALVKAPHVHLIPR